MSEKKLRKSPDTYQTKMVIAVRGTTGWLEWVKGLARHHRGMTIPQLIEESLIDMATKTGYKPKPPNRIER